MAISRRQGAVQRVGAPRPKRRAPARDSACPEEVVVLAAAEFRRLKGERPGQALIDALKDSPFPEIDLEPESFPMPLRDVKILRDGCSTPMSCRSFASPAKQQGVGVSSIAAN